MKNTNRNSSKKHSLIVAAAFLLTVLMTTSLQAQVRAGGAYLKLNPGTNAQALAGSVTGTLDHMYAVYANPAATAVLREWQWSVAYTKWIPDIYHAALFYGQRIRTPWSPWTRFYASISTLGVPEFDSSNGREAAVSGNDLLLSAGIGNTFAMSNHQLAWGGGIKYLRSELDNFNAGTFGFDLGGLYRTPKFTFMPGFLDEGIFSVGASLTQLGSSLKFKTFETPLPRTFRAGLGLELGKHQGVQTHLSLDFNDIRDEDSYFTLGGAFSYAQIFTLRAGYSFENDNLLQSFSFGLSLGLDDIRAGQSSPIPGKNNTIGLDLSGQEDNTYFESPYRGTFAHKPIRPEAFRPLHPAQGELVAARDVELSWEVSREPDLFDEVRYWLLVHDSPDQLQTVLAALDQSARTETMRWTDPATLAADFGASMLINTTLTDTKYMLASDSVCSGNYYWSVVAFDKDQHYRIMQDANGNQIAHFSRNLPNLQITTIELQREPLPNNGDAPYLRIGVRNSGTGDAGSFYVAVRDSAVEQFTAKQAYASAPVEIGIAEHCRVSYLAAGEQVEIKLPWQPRPAVQHFITAFADSEYNIAECSEDDNGNSTEIRDNAADVSVTKTVDKAMTWEDDVLSYTVTVKNNGPGIAKNITLIDIIPKHTSVQATEDNSLVFKRPDTLFTTIDVLAAHGERTFKYTLNVRDRLFNTQMKGVNFDVNSADLRPNSRDSLRQIAPRLANAMQDNKQTQFYVDGHTSSEGPVTWNNTLSRLRAESVKKFLTNLTIPNSNVFGRLIPRGYGSSSLLKPDSAAADFANRELNRRVEITYRTVSAIGDTLTNTATVSALDDLDPGNNQANAQVVLIEKPKLSLGRPCLDVQFANGSSVLTSSSMTKLDAVGANVADFLAENPTLYAVIKGHTSALGRSDKNKELSDNRAKRVRDYLIANNPGITATRIYAFGYGECYPLKKERVESESSVEASANRRIELYFETLSQRNTSEGKSNKPPCDMLKIQYEPPANPCDHKPARYSE